jgi:hypothetical protein
MRCIFLVSTLGLLAVTGCNNSKQPNEADFAKAINQYLVKHGTVCTVIGRQFPIDIPQAEERERFGIGPKLAALEQAGLLHASDTRAVLHGMLDPLRGSGPSQQGKRYEVTADGKRYIQLIPGTLGQVSGVCYGQKSVDSIVKWTEPVTPGASSQIEVTYTYKIVGLASWAALPEVQQAFSDIRTTANGTSKTTEVAGLQLTSKGWEVAGQ